MLRSAGDKSTGSDGTMNGDGLRAPLGTGAREPTPWGDRAIGGGDPTQTCAAAPPGHGVLEAAVKAAEPQVRMAILKELLRDMSLLEKVRREQ